MQLIHWGKTDLLRCKQQNFHDQDLVAFVNLNLVKKVSVSHVTIISETKYYFSVVFVGISKVNFLGVFWVSSVL